MKGKRKNRKILDVSEPWLPGETDMDAQKEKEAYDLLERSFAAPLRIPYLPGKTAFRDFLYENLGWSQMEAEAMVDTLEKTGRIAFRKDAEQETEGVWEIL